MISIRALTVLLIAVAAVGCGKPGSPPVKGPQPEALPAYQVDAAFRLPESRTWEKARRRGHLVVGAKEDQPYMGEKDPASGRYSGFDIEIAKMMSASLGFDPKTIEFRTIASANRETALQNGQIDYYVGTYTINDNRKKQVGFAGPYFMAGQSLLVRRNEKDIKGPQDLAGKKVCSAAGSTPYQRLQKEFPKAVLVAYDTYSACVDNLLTYQVDAVSTDDSILLGYAAKVPEELKVVGEPFSKEPYGIGVPRSDNALRFALDDALEAQEKNGNWKRAYAATLGLSGVPAPTPPPSTATPRAEGEGTDMDVLTENFAVYGKGFLGTVQLTVYASLLALVLGFVMASFRVAPVGSFRVFGTVWVTVLRNTPLTLLFFAVLLGLPRFGIVLPFQLFAILALGCYTSAFICEVLRSGINTVPKGQGEAARSLGMNFGQTLGTVVLPQAFRSVIPPIGSTLIALAKNSAIAGAFSVNELLGTYKTLNELGYSIVWTFFWIAVGYLIITLSISALFNVLEKRYGVAR